MALQPNRYEAITDITFHMNATAERGGIACVYTAGSGAAMDQSAADVRYLATPSGYLPMGILLNDVVNIDLTRQTQNIHKDEVQQGNKVTLLMKGWVVTNWVHPQVAPSANDPVFVHQSGYLSDVIVAQVTHPYPCGRFMSGKDAEGYYKVWIDCPPTHPLT